jgi:hypothetical protein
MERRNGMITTAIPAARAIEDIDCLDTAPTPVKNWTKLDSIAEVVKVARQDVNFLKRLCDRRGIDDMIALDDVSNEIEAQTLLTVKRLAS